VLRLGAPLDTGGIGKGLALRWAWHSLEPALGERGAILEAGGDPGGEGLLATTVAAPDPAWAEVWSKARAIGIFRTASGRRA